jgi:hypothetical protein
MSKRRSWFNLVSCFLSKDIREVVRGDIAEQRLEMTGLAYSRAWIELSTAFELTRSVFRSWGAVARELIVALVKWGVGISG